MQSNQLHVRLDAEPGRLSLWVQGTYEVIIIGGGHAGTEAAWAAANALDAVGGGRVALITMDPSKIGAMSCNPAIGGLAKGQIVREIDALGGLMGLATDATGIQFRMLNMSKGPAVRGPRAQCDKYAYAAEIQRLISTRANIDVIAGTVDEIIVEDGEVRGVIVPDDAHVVHPDPCAIEWNRANRGKARPAYSLTASESLEHDGVRTIRARAVVLTTGTFMRGLMHTGEKRTEGGRVDEGSAVGISGMLRSLGFELGRLKTGTPPRLARESIDWESLERQPGDETPTPFSDLTPGVLPGSTFPTLPQIDCHSTRTTLDAHEAIRANLHRAPMYSGQIQAETGPRYCPSIEDKVVRFADRDSHNVFLEPESLHTNEIYCNGISTSLPQDVQEILVRSMPGCERATVLKWGYAVEYDMVWPHQIDATCETKRIRGLFLAGQINCTTGYEEAGAQGLVAGINAARRVQNLDPVIFRRDESYIGVMMDDLVTKTPREPYRMFTSRAEYRLLLRADNADQRLTPRGRELGLVDDERWTAFETRAREIERVRDLLRTTRANGRTLRDIAVQPRATVRDVISHSESLRDVPDAIVERAMIELQYEGYINRQHAEIRRQEKTESMRIPPELDPTLIAGLRTETRETLARFRPTTLGQAGRLAGINPADVTILAIAIQRFRDEAGHDRTPAGCT